MINTNAPTTINLSIYQMYVYRLLALLLADKTIAKNKQFNPLGEHFTEGEVNRLLVMIAVLSRQLLDDVSVDNKKFGGEACGQYRQEGGQGKPLSFRNACNQIIHAQEILLYHPAQQKNRSIKYFEGIIAILSMDKQSVPVEAELDFLAFASVCVRIANNSSTD